jgi:FtsH-binding integral membrane protein
MSYFPSNEEARRVERPASGALGRLDSGFLGKVFGLLAFSLAFAAAGGVVGAQLGAGWILPMFIVEFALIFVIQAVREKEGLNFVALYAFAFVSGVTIGPLLAEYVSAGLGTAVLEATVVTGAMTAGISTYALTTKRNLQALRPYLFIALIGLIVALVVNIFIGGSALYAFLSWGGALLFSALLLVDVNRTKYLENTMGNAVVVTLGIYLDIVNLFLFVLSIFGGGGARRS